MKFLFASEFQHLPQKFGGVQSNTHELSRELVKRGHLAAVAAELLPSDYTGLRTRVLGKIIPKRKVHDSFLGYPTYRRWSVLKALPGLVEEIRPDVAIVQPVNLVPLAQAFRRLSIPTIMYFHDVNPDMLGGDLNSVRDVIFLANSEFTARWYRKKFGINPDILTPLFQADQYKIEGRPRNITIINPLPQKGSDLVLEIAARCPDIPFCFVESWKLSKEQKLLIHSHMKIRSNLTLRGRTMNMKSIYRHAKIILMPSRLEEAWGRVASEAHFSGIPVIASDRGGLPEAVGPGGILLDPDGPIEAWVAAVRKLWDDESHYSKLSAAARSYSTRPQIDPETQVDTLLTVARKAIEQQGAQRDSPRPREVP